jgi:Kef-type K+ transport system membrane component KefB
MKIILIFLLLIAPLSVRAQSTSSTLDYSHIGFTYGLSLLIIIFFAVTGFLGSRFIKKKLDEYNKRLEERYCERLAGKKRSALVDLQAKETAKGNWPEERKDG